MVRLLWFFNWYTCILPCSPALVRISRQRKSSAALEYRLARGHECRAPFHVVLARETAVDHLLAQRHVDMALCQQVVDRCFASEDYVEGRTAFMATRKP